MSVRESRHRPDSWAGYRSSLRYGWTAPVLWIEWVFQWMAYLLSQWAILEVLRYLGVLSVVFGVISYWSEAGDRRKQKHNQAWQVINTAQGKGGSGGRIEALQELNADGVSLTGVDVSGAFLLGVRLPKAALNRADFAGADARGSYFVASVLEFADLRSANLRQSNLTRADLRHADLEDADLTGATLNGANLAGASLKNADLTDCDLKGVSWQGIKAVDSANVYGVRNAPDGFMAWAKRHGARSTPSEE
jgi:hypothetical protein